MLHAQASRDRLVAAADQQAAYQSYVPAAISGMGQAMANAASSIVGGGDVSACKLLNGDWQAGPFTVLSCAPDRLVLGPASSNACLDVLTVRPEAELEGAVGGLLGAGWFEDLDCRCSAACHGPLKALACWLHEHTMRSAGS